MKRGSICQVRGNTKLLNGYDTTLGSLGVREKEMARISSLAIRQSLVAFPVQLHPTVRLHHLDSIYDMPTEVSM